MNFDIQANCIVDGYNLRDFNYIDVLDRFKSYRSKELQYAVWNTDSDEFQPEKKPSEFDHQYKIDLLSERKLLTESEVLVPLNLTSFDQQSLSD